MLHNLYNSLHNSRIASQNAPQKHFATPNKINKLATSNFI